MRGAKGSALEWALALLRAPGERHALRQKQLPAGIDRLLGVAAGAMPDALDEATRTYGEPEARVREAAQFYAREVLFFPQADAYRVLGVGSDASAEQIKAHHRLLQHWLHPDRLQSDDDAIFAARVNSAWNRLRSPDRRQAYDEARRQNRPPEVFDSSGALRSVHAWVAEPELPANPWRHRLPVFALCAACLVLVMLVARDMQRSPQGWDLSVVRASDENTQEDAAGIEVPRVAKAQATAPKPAPGTPARPAVLAHRRAPEARMHEAVVVAEGPPEPTPSTQVALSVPSSPTEQAGLPAASSFAPASPVRAELIVQSPARDDLSALASPKPASPADPAPPSFTRIQSARHVGAQFLRYMGAVNRPTPPIWNSPLIQVSAERMRNDLHGTGRARLSGEQWRIGNETAVLTSGFATAGEAGGQGRLSADLVWRDDRWLVTGLSVDRDP